MCWCNELYSVNTDHVQSTQKKTVKMLKFDFQTCICNFQINYVFRHCVMNYYQYSLSPTFPPPPLLIYWWKYDILLYNSTVENIINSLWQKIFLFTSPYHHKSNQLVVSDLVIYIYFCLKGIFCVENSDSPMYMNEETIT